MTKPKAREDAAQMSSVSFANLDICAAGLGVLENRGWHDRLL